MTSGKSPASVILTLLLYKVGAKNSNLLVFWGLHRLLCQTGSIYLRHVCLQPLIPDTSVSRRPDSTDAPWTVLKEWRDKGLLFLFFSSTFLLWKNIYDIQFAILTLLKCTIQWYFVHSQCCKTILIYSRTCLYPSPPKKKTKQKNPHHQAFIRQLFPFSPPMGKSMVALAKLNTLKHCWWVLLWWESWLLKQEFISRVPAACSPLHETQVDAR